MEEIRNDTQNSGTEERTFTQDDVNRIVQERLAKEKSKGNIENDRRAAELDLRERRLNAIDELRKNNLPDYLVDALNMSNDETFKISLEMIKKMNEEGRAGATPGDVRIVDTIGSFGSFGYNDKRDPVRDAFGLK